jgi:hypothetical protein
MPSPPVRSIALPVEHGGWGFTLEPLALGLLLAPTAGGVAIAVAAIAVFLAHRPVRLVLVDLVRGRWLPRSVQALRFAGGYGVVAASGLAVATTVASATFWIAVAGGSVPAAYAMWADSRSRSRTLDAELAGALAMATSAPAIALAAGRSAGAAFGLWLVLAGRDVASIVFVRHQLAARRDTPVSFRSLGVSQAAVLAVVAVAAAAGMVPALSVAALGGAGLFAVAAGRGRTRRRATQIGWIQAGIGAGVVAMTVLGVNLGW